MFTEKKEYIAPVTDLTTLDEEDIILASLGEADSSGNRTEVDDSIWWG